MIEIESDSSAFMLVVQRGVEATYNWTGDIALELSEVRYSGSGSISADVSSLSGAFDKFASSSQGFPLAHFSTSRPGVLRKAPNYGSAFPANGDGWSASRVSVTGLSTGTHQDSLRFAILGDLSVPGEGAGRAFYWRYVYQGGGIQAANTYTEIKQEDGETEYRLDRISGKFFGRRLDLRNLTTATEQSRSFVAAVVDGSEALNDDEALALWLLVSYLSGARLKSVYGDTFDESGLLIQRIFRLGAPYGEPGLAPFDLHAGRPAADVLSVIGEGFVRMITAGFPIGIVLHHLLDANTRNPELDSVHLYLAIQTAMEAWNGHVGRNEIVDPKKWSQIRPTLTRAAEELLIDAPASLINSVLGRIASANQVSFAERQRRFFADVGITLDDRMKRALRKRNELFHFGYFRERFGDLNEEERQERVDLPGILRNLVNLVVLKLVGYDGYATEATRYQSLRVERGPAPFGI